MERMERWERMMLGAAGQAVGYTIISALLSRAKESTSADGGGATPCTAQEANAPFSLYHAFFGASTTMSTFLNC